MRPRPANPTLEWNPMSSIPTQQDGQTITHRGPCKPWCRFWPNGHDPDDMYCQQDVGRIFQGVSFDNDGYRYEVAIGRAEARWYTTRYGGQMVQVTVYPLTGQELPNIRFEIHPSEARSIAAALIRTADLADELPPLTQ